VQTILDPATGAFQLASRCEAEAGTWTVHTRGTIQRAVDVAPPPPRDVAAIIARGTLVPDFYERLLSAEEHWLGPSYRTITRLWRRDGEALAELALPSDGVLGCALELGLARRIAIGEVYGQVLMPAVPDYERILGEGGDTFVGHEMAASVAFVRALEQARYCHAVLGGDLVGDLALLDADGAVLAEVRGLKVARISRALVRGALAAAAPRAAPASVWAPEAFLCERVARLLGVGADGVNATDAPLDLGLDSLMIVELRDAVVAELGVALPIDAVAGGATIAELAALLTPG
jgi:acyl carrier protein